MQFIRISSACATAAGVTSSVTRMPVTAESGSPTSSPTLSHAMHPKGRQHVNGFVHISGCVFHVFFSFYGRCRVPGWGRRPNRPPDGFPRASPAYGASRRACGPGLSLAFAVSLCSRGSAAHTPNSSRIRFTAASASSLLPYGSSVKPRLPDTMAESRRLSLGRYRI